MNKARGFTLIELLMVIAILGIISTLAVSKIGGVREASSRRVSLANQAAVERAIGSFLAGGGRINRLDSLVSVQGGDVTKAWIHAGRESGGGGFDCTYTNFTAASGREELYLGPTQPGGGVSADALGAFRADWNAGVMPGLQQILCPYELKSAQVDALSNQLGLRYVMAHNEYAFEAATAYAGKACGDGSYVESRGDSGRNPNESACAAIAITNSMAVFAVNPLTEKGRAVYRACGQALLRTGRSEADYSEDAAVAEVYSTGGPLLAFGLGESCSAIGSANAGLESAPVATYPMRQYYARYILLIRLRSAGAVTIPEFAGVIDPDGNTIRAAREIVRNL